MGAARSIDDFSWPCLSRTEMRPLNMPSAMYWPSLFQRADMILEYILCLLTDFCSFAHRPKSVAVHEASISVVGLYTTHWIESLCEYFRMPSALFVQMMIVLSSPPDAKRLPSREYSTAHTVSL